MEALPPGVIISLYSTCEVGNIVVVDGVPVDVTYDLICGGLFLEKGVHFSQPRLGENWARHRGWGRHICIAGVSLVSLSIVGKGGAVSVLFGASWVGGIVLPPPVVFMATVTGTCLTLGVVPFPCNLGLFGIFPGAFHRGVVL